MNRRDFMKVTAGKALEAAGVIGAASLIGACEATPNASSTQGREEAAIRFLLTGEAYDSGDVGNVATMEAWNRYENSRVQGTGNPRSHGNPGEEDIDKAIRRSYHPERRTNWNEKNF